MEFLMYVASLKGLDREKAKMRSRDLLQKVNLEGDAKMKIKTYSSGMKRRLGIAQVLLNKPKLIVLDEPTAGLDPKERVRFRHIFEELGKDNIVLLSTHIVSDIEISGFNAPLQIRIHGCMLNITIGQTYIYLFVLFLIAGIIYSAFAMFLSQVLNNRSAATAIMVIGLFLSMINAPEAFGLLSKVWSYLPGAYIGSWTFTEYNRLFHIFGKFFNNLQMAPVFWLIASILFIAIAGSSYKHYQVKGK